VEAEDEGEDPRWELIRQLVEYKKFKDAAARLQELEWQQEAIFPRVPGKLEFEREIQPARAEASLFDLLNAVNSVLQRFTKRDDPRDIFEDKWSVSEKIEHLMNLLKERSPIKFSEAFAGVASRGEVVVTFLALLELIRLKQLAAVQNEAFGEIEICRAEAAPAATAAISETEPPNAAAEQSSLAT